MRKCIICDLDKEEKEFNMEHIIPDALGNKSLYFYKVCKECNGKLGRNVDFYLTDYFLTILNRNRLRLKSQNDVIPNPFSKGKDSKGRIVKTDVNFNPSVESFVKEEDGIITVEAATIEAAKSISRKKLMRKGYKEEEVERLLENASIRTEFFQPDMKMDVIMDIGKLEVAILKIAYEYGILKLGELFYKDVQAGKIRKILKNASEGNYDDKYKMIRVMSESVYENIINRAPSGENVHILCLDEDGDNKLIVNIILFKDKLLSFSVCVSLKSEIYNVNEFNIDIVKIEGSQE